MWSRLLLWNCLLDGEAYATKPMSPASAVCVAVGPAVRPLVGRHRPIGDGRGVLASEFSRQRTGARLRACSMARRLDRGANMQLISSRFMRRTHRYRAMCNSLVPASTRISVLHENLAPRLFPILLFIPTRLLSVASQRFQGLQSLHSSLRDE